MRQNDSNVHNNLRPFQVLVKQFETVEDVDGQPANGKQSHNNGEGFSGPDLLLQQPVVMAVPVANALELDLSQLLPGHREDLQVDAQHDEQGWQHADKEVKINHVPHVHHTLKETLEHAPMYRVSAPVLLLEANVCCSVLSRGGAITFRVQVPSKERDEANDKGEDP